MHTAAMALKPTPDAAAPPSAGQAHLRARSAAEGGSSSGAQTHEVGPIALQGSSSARITLATVVALAHLAGLGALAHFGMQPTTPPEITPIQVALIEAAPVAVNEPVATAPDASAPVQPQAPEPAPPPKVIEPEPPPPPPPPPEPKPEPKPRPVPKPKPTPRKPPPKPVAKETAPTTTSPTAVSGPSEPSTQAPVAAAPSARTGASAASGAPALTQARYDAAYLNNPHPTYPMSARRLREEGKVMLRVLVSSAGLPSRVELRSSSGSARLDRAAREAVARWRFVPAKRGNAAVESWVLVPIVFKLQGN